MKYVSLDIETTGLDPNVDQIIEFGAIIEDTENELPFDKIPKYRAIIKHDRYSGSAFALSMNQRIFKILADRVKINDEEEKKSYDYIHNIISPNELVEDFYVFLYNNIKSGFFYGEPIKINVAGKNFNGFDKNFLSRLPEWNKDIQIHYRTIDPASMFWKPLEDKVLPSLEECMRRAGIENPVVTHDAVQDAWDVIQVLRTKY